jgi:hypothetical protein
VPAATDPPASPSVDLPAVGGLADLLLSPVLAGFRVTAGLVVSVEMARPHAPDPATLQPGGGSAADSATWQPTTPVQLPVAVAVPTRTGRKGPLTKDELLWAAYTSAADRQGGCHLPVMLVAAIGEVESASLRGRTLDRAHDATPPVRGPALAGGSYASIHDSDGGRYDGDPVWDHAVGPMQFIPATWRIWGADGNGDGVRDPQNIEDAALAAAHYLCAGGRDLSRPADLQAAVLSYNHSQRYVATVLGIVQAVDSGELAGP